MSSLLKQIRNALCKCSGEDFAIIRLCSTKVQLYFTFIGLFVSVILLCCFISAWYFTESLFHSFVVAICVGFIWGYIITNLYILLLYTITPTLLPVKQRRKSKTKTATFRFNTSMILRVGLVVLLAMITAQPLNIFVIRPNSTAFANDVKLLLGSSFIAWGITTIVVFIFIFPIILKYKIRKLGEFYELKASIKKRIIIDDYLAFKHTYSVTLEKAINNYNQIAWTRLIPFLNRLEKVNYSLHQQHFTKIEQELAALEIQKYEYWADPPYRTQRKSNIYKARSEKDFLTHIYKDIH
jgi:uncharacterized membrane protein